MSDVSQRLSTALTGRYRVERELGAGALCLTQIVRALRSEPFEELGVGEKVSGREVKRPEPEVLQRLHNPFAILEIGTNEKVEIFRQSRSAVERDGVSANDEEFNARRVEQREQFAQVLVQHRRERRGSEPAAQAPGQGAPGVKAPPRHRGRRHRPRDAKEKSE